MTLKKMLQGQIRIGSHVRVIKKGRGHNCSSCLNCGVGKTGYVKDFYEHDHVWVIYDGDNGGCSGYTSECLELID